jgi:DNA-binding LytR/AlgR family response regulator
MPDFRIDAGDKTKGLLRELLKASGCGENDGADIVLTESGRPLPDKGLAVVFRTDDLAPLVRFLQTFTARPEGMPVLIGRKHQTWEPLKIEEILFFKAEGDSLFANTARQPYEMRQKLYELAGLLPPGRFIRVNKSYVVNILQVREIVPWFGGRLLLRITGSEERIEVSRHYLPDFKQFLGM